MEDFSSPILAPVVLVDGPLNPGIELSLSLGRSRFEFYLPGYLELTSRPWLQHDGAMMHARTHMSENTRPTLLARPDMVWIYVAAFTVVLLVWFAVVVDGD